ncbi:MAG: outer membrane protein, partial [Pseudorhodoplanes sp.]
MKYLLAALATLATVGSASAADLAYRGARPPVAAPIYSPFYNWTGFYVGINGGGGFGGSTWDGVGDFNVSGGMIGVTAGYNYQINQFVLGAEADIDWSGMNGSNNGCFLGCETRNSWLGTFRGRLGYAFDRFMPYLTAGVALGNISANLPVLPILPGGSTTTAGWT